MIESPMFQVGLWLVAAGDGTEVIRQTLGAGSRWALSPAEGWHALEHFTVLSGSLHWHRSDGVIVLGPGDSVSAVPVTEDCIFVAETDTEMLYVSSQPVFHHYSQEAQRMMDLAVQVEIKDGNTADHCRRIVDLSMKVGQALALSPSDTVALNYGAFLHDIGKVRVPDHILGKAGPLTDDEWQVMRCHPTWGGEMLEGTSLSMAAPIVKQHHERWDGSGYPRGLQGDEISLGAAIVAVVDSFDAMTADRVYRKGRPTAEAVAEIERHRGTLYNPLVVDAFLGIADTIT